MRGYDARQVFGQWQQYAAAQAQQYSQLRDEVSVAIDEVRGERTAVAGELAVVYVPELSESALAAAERRTGFRGFSRRNPIQAMPRELTKLSQLLASLEADERWQKRESLVGPYGSLSRQVEEARSHLEPWVAECQVFEVHEGFLELIEIGYDTPDFAERWWQPAYWRHWAAGDRITEALGKADFGDEVLPAYLAAREKRDGWRAQVEAIEARVAAVHDLVRRRDETLWRRDHLPEIYLEEARKLIADHLDRADVQLLAQWAEEDRGILVLLKRLSGLRAKEDVLVDLRDRWVGTQAQSLQAAADKWGLKATKLMRPKKAAMDVLMPEGVEEKLRAHDARVVKARGFVHRVRGFRDYDRYDLGQPPETWYLHFSGNRRPTALTPQYVAWYDRHPDVVVVTDPSWESERVPLELGNDLAAAGDVS